MVAADGAGIGSHRGWLLAVCCVAQFMVILDLTIVNVALPSIQSSLDFSATELQWVVDAYAIVFAGFLMLGGRATDHFGHRRSLVVALSVFALASLIGGSAPDRAVLVAARALQGLAGALMAAGSLATITSTFAQGAERHRAIGLWGAMNGAGGAAGTLFGGIITQELGWRWVLLINPPIGLGAAAVAYVVIRDREHPAARTRFDLAGALALTGGLMVLVYGIVTAGANGWDSSAALVPVVVGLALLLAFPLIEARLASAPLVPPGAFTGQLRVANIVVLCFSAALFPMWYVSSLYLQQVLALSPLATGLTFLPMALTIMVIASQAGRLVGRFGPRTVLVCGLTMMLGGMLLLARIGSSGSALGYVMLPGLLVAAGIGLSIVPSTIAATQSASAAQAGLASGLVNTARQVGGALGIALLISLATQDTSSLIGRNRPVPGALTDGFRLAYLLGAGFVALALLATLVLLARPAASTAPQPARRLLPGATLLVIGCFLGLDLGFAGGPGAPIGAYTTVGAARFVSAPGLHPPQVSTDTPTLSAKLASGYIMVTDFYNLAAPPMIGQGGPLLLDNALQPVWFKPVPTDVVAADLNEQTYAGQPVLTWWQGVVSSTGATESGEDIVVNDHYQTIATLRGRDGWVITLHSMVITGNDAWVTANKNIPMNLAPYGGATHGALTDSAVQEYNLRTGRLLRSWDALGHISLDDSYTPPPTNGFPWDAYHVNSIELTGKGALLISMRDTWAAYKIDIASGRIEWTLGGKHSSFSFGPKAAFSWQHDVALNSGSLLTLFDDHCCEITGSGTYLAATGPSRALVLRLDLKDRRATFVAQYTHGSSADAAYMGSTELLANGNVFVGWGALPYFSEYSSTGKLLLGGVLPGPDISYRATTLAHWVGLPLSRPAGAARRSGAHTTVYASWNGATQVASWRVLAGASVGHLAPIASARRSGFETAISVHRPARVLEVEALDGAGKVLGQSAPFEVTR